MQQDTNVDGNQLQSENPPPSWAQPLLESIYQLVARLDQHDEHITKLGESIGQLVARLERDEDLSKRDTQLELLSAQVQLNDDTLKMLTTERLAQAAGYGEHDRPTLDSGPTGHYLVEPRSRWKRTSLYGH